MKILKRTLKSTVNLKKRTIIIGLLFLVVLTFLISGSSVQSTLKSVLNENQNKMNSIVTIGRDTDSMMKSAINPDENESKESLDSKLVDKIKKSKYIKDYSVQALERVFTQYSEKKKEATTGYIAPDTKVSILDSTNKQIAAATINLIEGELPNESKETNAIIVSKSYIDEYKLKIGDTLDLEIPTQNNKNNRKTKATISGVFKMENDNPDELKKQEKSMLYGSEELVTNLKKESFTKSKKESLTEYDKIKVELNSSKDVKKFISEMKSDGGDYSLLEFKSSYGEFETISQMIDSFIKMVGMIKVIIVIVAGLIISLVMMLSLRERKKEIGILLSLGETKKNVLLQMFLEVALILIAIFFISFITSTYITTPIATSFVNNEMQVSISDSRQSNESITKENANREDNNSQSESKTNIDKKYSVDVEESLVTLLMILIITGISTTIPTASLLKKSPINILSSKE